LIRIVLKPKRNCALKITGSSAGNATNAASSGIATR